MPAPGRANLNIYQGASWTESIIVREPDGDPVDLTGRKARLSILDDIKGVALATLTTENGGLTIDGPAGKVTPVMSYLETTDLPVVDDVESFPYVLKIINETPNPDVVDRILEGYAIVWPDPEPLTS